MRFIKICFTTYFYTANVENRNYKIQQTKIHFVILSICSILCTHTTLAGKIISETSLDHRQKNNTKDGDKKDTTLIN